jgi:hypothetical protein
MEYVPVPSRSETVMEKQLRVTSGGRAAAVAAGVVVASCIAPAENPPPAAPTPATAAPVERLANGEYACVIQSGAYRSPSSRCAVYVAEDGSQILEKLGGSQRFRGRVMPDGRGFSFDGMFFCPYGDCTESVSARFASVGASRYRGIMQGRSGPLAVSLDYLPGGFRFRATPASAAE